MNATTIEKPAPLYAVVDKRQDGRRRIVAEYVDPDVAKAHADALRAAGAAAEVELITAVQEDGTWPAPT